MPFLETLKKRGLLAQSSHENELLELLTKDASKKIAIYCGFDPTAKSLHIGNLAALLVLRRAQDYGLKPIILFGGATALIGDPTGRKDMRPMNNPERISQFIENFKNQVLKFFNTDAHNVPMIVNNYDWFQGISFLDFLRDVGIHFTIPRLLAAEVNKSRFKEGGLTFMELGYQLLQAYDFLHLNKEYNCLIQVGGDDQWSNVLAGADLIRRVSKRKAFALTTPLIVDHEGRKLGKTEGNAIWLDKNLLSSYEFFQFFRNRHDNDIEHMLRVFTLLEDDIIQEKKRDLAINQFKEFMAYEITKFVHGQDDADKALETSKKLFQKDSTVSDLESAPTSFFKQELFEKGLGVLDLMVHCKLCASKGEARRLILGGGIKIFDTKVIDPHLTMFYKDFKDNMLLIKKGKKSFHVVKIEQS